MPASFLVSRGLCSFAFTGALFAVACGNKADDDDSNKGGAGAAAMNGGTTNAGTGATQGGSGNAANGGSAGAGTGNTTGGTGGSSNGGMGAGGSAGKAMNGGSAGSGMTMGGANGSGAGVAGAQTGGDAGMAPGGSGGMPMGGAAGSGMSGSGGGGLKDPVPSKGCDSSAAPPASGEAMFQVGSKMREYILRLPEGYDGKTPMRIIFAFHGAQGSAVQVDNGDPPNDGLEPTGPYYGIKEHADDHTIFVAGQADGTWNDGDVDYVTTLVDKLKGELCLDESRILATGFSMGGIMTLRVACNLYDTFRAVAPMSCSLSASNCPAGGAHIAYWSSHGEQDTTINISNGEAARDEFAKRNGCSMDDPTPYGSDGCVAYQGCDDGYPVNWCQFEGIHQPPPFSGPAIWEFLSQF